MSLQDYIDLWNNASSSAFWCEIYQYPLHRTNPVVLNYENLPDAIKNAIKDPHEGKTGHKIIISPKQCYKCIKNIRNKGICDPV